MCRSGIAEAAIGNALQRARESTGLPQQFKLNARWTQIGALVQVTLEISKRDEGIPLRQNQENHAFNSQACNKWVGITAFFALVTMAGAMPIILAAIGGKPKIPMLTTKSSEFIVGGVLALIGITGIIWANCQFDKANLVPLYDNIQDQTVRFIRRFQAPQGNPAPPINPAPFAYHATQAPAGYMIVPVNDAGQPLLSPHEREM